MLDFQQDKNGSACYNNFAGLFFLRKISGLIKKIVTRLNGSSRNSMYSHFLDGVLR